jgi:hypothetical protein
MQDELPYWEKNEDGLCQLKAVGTSGDTIVTCFISMPEYLMQAGTYTIDWVTNLTTSSNAISVGTSKVHGSSGFFYYNYVSSGGQATVVNDGTTFEVFAAGVGMNDGTLDFHIVAAIEQIPASNAAFTDLALPLNQLTFNGNTYLPQQYAFVKDDQDYRLNGTAFGVGGFDYSCYFSSSFPPSGTYQVVSSREELAPGKVYLEFFDMALAQYYRSASGGYVTVITNESDISVSTVSVSMTPLLGGTDINLGGNISH